MKRKLPIARDVLMEREGQCLKCDFKAKFKDWKLGWLSFICPKCGYELGTDGAIRW